MIAKLSHTEAASHTVPDHDAVMFCVEPDCLRGVNALFNLLDAAGVEVAHAVCKPCACRIGAHLCPDGIIRLHRDADDT